jgi:regulator of nonsense transcripts 2
MYCVVVSMSLYFHSLHIVEKTSVTAEEMAEDFAAQLEALEALDVISKERDAMLELRRLNGPAIKKTRGDIEKKGNLKSDLKKSTAFVKKLRSINAEGLQQCIRDAEVLNMSLYTSEIVSAIVETSFKSTDVPAIMKLCITLHQRYEDFAQPLLEGFKSALLSEADDKDGDKRRRIQIRFIIELFQVGIMRDEEFFLALLRNILGKSAKGSKRGAIDLGSLVTYVKYAVEVLMNHAPRRVLALARAASMSPNDVPLMGAASPPTSRELMSLVSEACEQLKGDLIKAFADWKRLEKKAEKDRAIHGSLNEQRQTELDDTKKLYEKLFSSLTSLSESLDLVMPVLEEEKEEAEGTGGISVWDGGSVNVDSGPYGDAESRAFYEDLPDLLVMVPLTALGLTAEQAAALREQWRSQKENEASMTAQEESEIAAMDQAERNAPEDAPPAVDESLADLSLGGVSTATEADPAAADENSAGGAIALKLNVLLTEKLPDCNSKQKADDFSTSFCYCNSKRARKALVAALLKVPRNRAELIPNYARIIASLARLYQDIKEPILTALFGDFIGKFRSKFQFNFEDKVRTVKFIGELVKFRIAPPIMALKIFNTLISDFFNQNVLLCSILLETCGRYLYLLPYTHERIEKVLDSVLRLRRAKNLDSNQQMALEAAYFTVKPPDRIVRQRKVLTVMQQYIRHIFFIKLSPDAGVVDGIIKQLRKLPWNDPAEDIEFYVVKTAMKVAKTKPVDIPLVADTLAGLMKYHSRLHVRLIDSVCEELMRGMDSPNKREAQKLLGLARLLGECFNFAIINSPVIFEFLHLFIGYGHELPDTGPINTSTLTPDTPAADALNVYRKRVDPSVPTPSDPPADLFRAQLVCELIRSVASYFVKGNLKDKLNHFLLHFQKYLFFKSSLPSHVEFTILDLFDDLEAMAISARMKDRQSKKLTKEQKAAIAAELASMPLSFPRYESLDALQAELDKIQAESPSAGAQQGDEDDAEAAGGGDDGDQADEDEDEDGDNAEGGEEAGGDDGEDLEDELARREREEQAELEISEANAARQMAALRQQEQEDEEFERAFRSAMLESVSSAQSGGAAMSGGVSRPVAVDRMALPAVLPKPKNAMQFAGADDDEDEDDDNHSGKKVAKAPPVVSFKLLSRDTKGRLETRQFAVSKDSEMVVRLEKAGEQQKIERQRLKETVLRYENASAGAAPAVPVAYLGGRDVLSKQAQPYLASSSYRAAPAEQPSAATSSHSAAAAAAIATGAGKTTLNLSEFLAESSAAEIRRLQSKSSGNR